MAGASLAFCLGKFPAASVVWGLAAWEPGGAQPWRREAQADLKIRALGALGGQGRGWGRAGTGPGVGLGLGAPEEERAGPLFQPAQPTAPTAPHRVQTGGAGPGA